MPDKEESLILMARNAFGQLTEAEEKLFRAAAHGRVDEFRIGSRSAQEDWLVKLPRGRKSVPQNYVGNPRHCLRQ
jgi:hypothetical protein